MRRWEGESIIMMFFNFIAPPTIFLAASIRDNNYIIIMVKDHLYFIIYIILLYNL